MMRVLALLLVTGSTTFLPVQQNNRQAKQRQLFRLYEAHSFEKIPYRLLKPIDFKAGGKKKYPLILSLHGAGGKGRDNLKNLRNWNGYLADETLRRKHPCFVAAPQPSGVEAFSLCGPDELKRGEVSV